MPSLNEESGCHRVRLELRERSYDVFVGEGALGRLDVLEMGNRCAVVSDSHVAPLYGDAVKERLDEAGIESVTITVKAGEGSKSMKVAEEVCREMLQAGLDRKSFLVALGGGVVGDLAGSALRFSTGGIPCVQIPTTILSMVDSSVGGKTGVNTPEGKNLLGCFHQPSVVLG